MIFAKNFARNYEKNTWNIRRLVDESFVPVNQRIILQIVGFQDCELGGFCNNCTEIIVNSYYDGAKMKVGTQKKSKESLNSTKKIYIIFTTKI